MKRKESLGFTKSFLSDVKTVTVQTPSGLLVPFKGYDVDLDRLSRVISRVVRGLYFHTTRRLFPANHQIMVITRDILPSCDRTLLAAIKSVAEKLEGRPITSIGKDVFTFRWHIEPDEIASAWEMVFYRSVVFLAITAMDDSRQEACLEAQTRQP